MQVSELITLLRRFPQNAEVCINMPGLFPSMDLRVDIPGGGRMRIDAPDSDLPWLAERPKTEPTNNGAGVMENQPPKMLKICPTCESDHLGDFWVADRKLQQRCCDCAWVGKPRIPEQREIESTRIVSGAPSYWIFDRYGHPLVYSRTFASTEEAKTALMDELARGMNDKFAGPYTGVFWPGNVKISGEIFTKTEPINPETEGQKSDD